MNYLGAGTFNYEEQFVKGQFLLHGRRIRRNPQKALENLFLFF
jgi:hypothetical protein